MAKGVKYYKTVEKGDILTANEKTIVYELYDDGSLKLKQIDTVFKGDLIGFFSEIFLHDGVQYVEFVTIDSLNPDGSIDWNRRDRYFKWDFTDFTFTPNPNYMYRDKPEAKVIEADLVVWVKDNSQKVIIALSIAIVGIVAFWLGSRKKKTKLKNA